MNKIPLLSILFLTFSLSSELTLAKGKNQSQDEIVSVASYGAKGDGRTDDAAAIQKAILYCVRNNKICSIPKTSSTYSIGSTIRVPLEPGQSIKIVSDGATIKPSNFSGNNSAYNLTSFKEHMFLSIGKQINSLRNTDLFKLSDGSSINLSGIVIDGSSFDSPPAPTALTTDVYFGMQLLADNVTVTNCSFNNIYGYGITIYNVKNSLVKGCKFENVGGRGATVQVQKIDRDAFGDGLHYAMVKPQGKVRVEDCDFNGKRIKGKRSRSAITFEFSTQPYEIDINDVNIAGFAKCIHIEENAPSTVILNHVNMRDFNVGIANVLNDKSTISLNNVRMDVGLTDGNETGDALAFLNYRSKASITVDNSYLNFNGRKQAYQSVSGLVRVQNSTINANNTNLFFADGNTDFENCTFIGFGGTGKSFSSNTGQGVYRIRNSTFKDCSTIHANGQKLTLKMEGNKH